jgi:hypothetical protein
LGLLTTPLMTPPKRTVSGIGLLVILHIVYKVSASSGNSRLHGLQICLSPYTMNNLLKTL